MGGRIDLALKLPLLQFIFQGLKETERPEHGVSASPETSIPHKSRRDCQGLRTHPGPMEWPPSSHLEADLLCPPPLSISEMDQNPREAAADLYIILGFGLPGPLSAGATCCQEEPGEHSSWLRGRYNLQRMLSHKGACGGQRGPWEHQRNGFSRVRFLISAREQCQVTGVSWDHGLKIYFGNKSNDSSKPERGQHLWMSAEGRVTRIGPLRLPPRAHSLPSLICILSEAPLMECALTPSAPPAPLSPAPKAACW